LSLAADYSYFLFATLNCVAKMNACRMQQQKKFFIHNQTEMFNHPLNEFIFSFPKQTNKNRRCCPQESGAKAERIERT